jgi:hypothetical protein
MTPPFNFPSGLMAVRLMVAAPSHPQPPTARMMNVNNRPAYRRLPPFRRTCPSPFQLPGIRARLPEWLSLGQ